MVIKNVDFMFHGFWELGVMRGVLRRWLCQREPAGYSHPASKKIFDIQGGLDQRRTMLHTTHADTVRHHLSQGSAIIDNLQEPLLLILLTKVDLNLMATPMPESVMNSLLGDSEKMQDHEFVLNRQTYV